MPYKDMSLLSVRSSDLLTPQSAHLKLTRASDAPQLVNLSVAENALCLPLVRSKLGKCVPCTCQDAENDCSLFVESIRKIMCRFIPDARTENVVICQGATGIVDALCFALGDEDDVILVLSPYYGGFRRDISTLSRLKLEVVDGEGTMLERLQRRYDDQSIDEDGGCKEHSKVVAVLLCNPGNPDGVLLDESTLVSVVQWARTVGIHVIMDEAYALSVHSEDAFRGSANVLEAIGGLKNDVHVVWTLSKDFGLSGMRMGILYSQNEGIIETMKLQSHGCGNRDMQHWLSGVLGDNEFVSFVLQQNQRELRTSYNIVRDSIIKNNLKFVEAQAGVFLWAYVGNLADEAEVWKRLIQEGVLVTQGSYCGVEGWIRICFASVDRTELKEGMRRFEGVIEQLRVRRPGVSARVNRMVEEDVALDLEAVNSD